MHLLHALAHHHLHSADHLRNAQRVGQENITYKLKILFFLLINAYFDRLLKTNTRTRQFSCRGEMKADLFPVPAGPVRVQARPLYRERRRRAFIS